MVAVRTALAGALVVLTGVLAALSALVGLSGPSWGVGALCGVILTGAVARAVGPAGGHELGPADLVTLARATITCAVAALVAESWLQQPLAVPVAALAAVALALDAVDGHVARATHTQSAFGGRFDGEADAFLLLVLSVHVAQEYGAWVLTIGVARYAFWAAGWVFDWFRRRLPSRPWCRVVAGVQGVVLVVAAAQVLPAAPTYVALAVALALLVESFGHDVLWLVRHRRDPLVDVPARVEAGRLPA